MEPTNNYDIILPKGEAKRPFYELSEAEQLEIGQLIFEEVTRLAAKVGALPVITENLRNPTIKD